jgi:2-hydroxychromene-2-carboxylate isomerase
MKAVWYFDVVSPFSYLALDEVMQLGRESLRIDMRPVLFAAMLNHWGQLGPAEVGPKRAHTYRMCVWKAREKGIDFRFPPAHPFNPLFMLRVLTALGGEKEAVRTVFELIWREGRDPLAPDTLVTLRERLGLGDLDGLIEHTDAKTRLRNGTQEAIAAHVFGVPTLAFGGQQFWGADAMPLARAFLANPKLFDDDELRRVENLPIGIERQK